MRHALPTPGESTGNAGEIGKECSFRKTLRRLICGAAGLALCFGSLAKAMPPLDLEVLPPGGGVPDPLLSRPDMDGNGVDLSVGAYNLSATDVVIGQPGAGGLAYSRSYVGGGWRSSFLGTIRSAGSKFIVSVNGAAEYFSYVDGTNFTNDDGTASTLVANGSAFTYTTGDGTVYSFAKNLKDIVVSSADEAILTSVTAPNGAVTTMHYNSATVSSQTRARLQSVTNTYGFQLHLDYADDSPANTTELNGTWLRVAAVTGINLAVEYCSSTAVACTLTGDWPQATFTGDTHQILTASDPEGRTTTYTYDINNRLQKVKYPGSGVDNLTIGYGGGGRVTSVNRGYATWSYAYADASGNRTTTITLPGGGTQVIVTNIAANTVTSVTDPLSRTTSYLYDANGRTTRVTAPEGNYVSYTYDARGNVTETRAVAKSGSGLADIVTSATFPASCSNLKTCNKPTSSTDARGEVTTYTYDANHGGVTSVKAPDPDNGGALVSPETRLFYEQKTARYYVAPGNTDPSPPIYLPVSTAACATSAFSSAYNAGATHANNNCGAGAGDKTVTETAWPAAANPNNLLPVSATARAGDSSVSSTSAFAYDGRGWLSSTDGPLAGTADTTVFFYEDTGRQYGMISPDPDGAGALKRRAARTLFNSMGLPYRAETGTATGQSAGDLSSMTVQQRADTAYDDYGRPVKSVAYQNATATVLAASQVSYDSAGRTDCAAMRMNPSIFGSLPSSACSLGTAGAYGPDRVSRKVYNTAGEVTKVVYAYGTALQQDAVTATYTNNGLVSTVTDAKGNKTAYYYDGFDRLKKTCFPSKTTPGTVSATDCEENYYTAAGLLDKVRPRKGSIASASTWDITFAYDDLGRVTTRHVPESGETGVPATENYTYTYDNFGRVKSGYHHYLTITYAYDALSRLTSRTHDIGSWTASYAYDAASRLTTLTYPDGWDVDYGYDGLGRPTTVAHDASTLATVSYDDFGRPSSLAYGNGTGATYAFDGLGRLSGLDWNLAGTGDDFGYDFSFNPGSQIVSSTVSDAGRAWSPPALGTDDYASNGLNQYAQIESASIVHDGSGNVTTDHRGRTYTYDADNRLKSAAAGATTLGSYIYSSEGAVRHRTGGGAYTRHFHDGGGQELAQYDGATYALQYRFVRLPGSVDDAFLMLDYVSSGCGSGCAVYVHKDARGSTVSTSDASGAETAAYQYSPYGESGPEGDAGFPFRFTGQRLDAATGLYNYKARFYNPETGRFLSADPIGYADGMNMYAYVGGDPVNATDPSGMVKHDGRVTYGGGGIPAVNYGLGGGGSYVSYGGNLYTAFQWGRGDAFAGSGAGGGSVGGPDSQSGHDMAGSSGQWTGDEVVVTGTRPAMYAYFPDTGFLYASYDGGGGGSFLVCRFVTCYGEYSTPSEAAESAAQEIVSRENPSIGSFPSGSLSSGRASALIIQRYNGTYARTYITLGQVGLEPVCSCVPRGAVGLVVGVGLPSVQSTDGIGRGPDSRDSYWLSSRNLSQGYLVTYDIVRGSPANIRVLPFGP